ncbi:protein OS-9 [Gadus macrocephalus]|uniref:protein OS-9 n=1 Tax=Gadus macrocephalus TaxID=80720 RepID=UPI0028CB60F6|nr:protein OS-9 [Gadus macrocephalus]
MAAALGRWSRVFYVFLRLYPCCIFGFLNIEELNEMKYGIQILPDPVVLGQTQPDEVMMVSNKFKQLYECRLPAQALRFHQDPASESEPPSYTGPGVTELLEPMHQAPCLVKTKDWWTYEFCHGKFIRQYHLEDTEIKGDILFLGTYESEFDWSNETAKASKQHRLRRYHSQTYVNGSRCDLNAAPRETEVRFVCEEAAGDYIARVDEPQSCRYVLTVHTSRTCQHPFLMPPSSARPQGIVCQPALSAQQYMSYVKAQVSDTKRKVEQISEELRTLDEMLAGSAGRALAETLAPQETLAPPEEQDPTEVDGQGLTEDGGPEEQEDPESKEGGTRPGGSKQAASHPTLKVADEDDDDSLSNNEVLEEDEDYEKFNFKIITDPADLMQFVQHLKESNRKKARNQARSEAEQRVADGAKDRHDDREKDEEEEEEEVEEESLLKEFEEETAGLLVPSEQIQEIKEEMQKEFHNIIDEAQQELETEGLKGEFDRSQATQTLETTLDKLLDRLEDKDAPVPEQPLAGGQRGSDPARGSPSLAPQQPDQAADDQVKIKITKYKTGSTPGGQVKVQEMGEGDPQWQHIKDVVKEQLEKAGLKAEGKIEVKILTRKNAEEAGDQWLTEEDTKSFRELLINLLTGGTEEVYKEQKRQQDLEDNYRFAWGQSQEEAQTSGPSDPDDVDL